MTRRLLSAVIAAICFPFLNQPSFAFIGGDEFRIDQFCAVTAMRRTVIYVDHSMMVDGEVEWAKRLREKLLANLVPSEPVELIRIDSDSGQSKEVWKACYPDYSSNQKAVFEKETYLFKPNPLTVLEKQQKVFDSELLKHLTDIYNSAKRPKGAARYAAGNAPKKNLVRALVNDESRYSRRDKRTRVIMYTDALEKSELYDVFAGAPAAPAALAAKNKYGVNFGQAVFYIYGAGQSLSDPGDAPSRAKVFWEQFLKQTNAHVSGFGVELNSPTSRPIKTVDLDLEVVLSGRAAVGIISLMPDIDGALQDSFVSISSLTGSAIEGTFTCNTSGKCFLKASTLSDLITDFPREEIKLDGPMDGMTGKVGVPNAYIEKNPNMPALIDIKAKIRKQN